MKLDEINIRKIQLSDNPFLADIIRNALTEFNAAKPGTVYYDETTDSLFDVFNSEPLSYYFVAEYNGEILGGAGIYPTDNLPKETCELVKMYLSPKARGISLGRKLIEQCILKAKELNFSTIYLESMPELKKAISVYEKFGFQYVPKPIGNSGHSGCNVFMTLSLQ